MPGGNVLTDRAREFLKRWHANGGHVEAACEGIFSHRKSGYRLIAKNAKGEFERDDVRAFMAQMTSRQIASNDVVSLPVFKNSTGAKRAPIPDGELPEVPEGGPDIEWQIQRVLVAMNDAAVSASALAQLSKELRSLMEIKGGGTPDPEKGIAILRAKMLPHMRPPVNPPPGGG
jgi:hypothetical protein